MKESPPSSGGKKDGGRDEQDFGRSTMGLFGNRLINQWEFKVAHYFSKTLDTCALEIISDKFSV
jgi:hypothetical protein